MLLTGSASCHINPLQLADVAQSWELHKRTNIKHMSNIFMQLTAMLWQKFLLLLLRLNAKMDLVGLWCDGYHK